MTTPISAKIHHASFEAYVEHYWKICSKWGYWRWSRAPDPTVTEMNVLYSNSSSRTLTLWGRTSTTPWAHMALDPTEG